MAANTTHPNFVFMKDVTSPHVDDVSQVCFTFSDPGPGATKLECFFPATGTANCDISLVDGYSVSVGCVPAGDNQLIGSNQSLLGHGIPCPDQQGPYCINTEGYAPSQSDVLPFFQQGVQNGNNYCIWDSCAQDYYFPTGTGLDCFVTA
ncbi:hypothetical protein M409DRAFT_24142 [Zasmidium cellare ATCC 36951]|uniref:Uncharacterized protein n=1 Tax=Zasmidium cellare ATCC 36951 TaxID=1080233 RepID=A0A6A6CDY2_ZASCE|nr:uncharacterized protein M409DRAFT_24142 [Zasmidium cellare ATCC 36951]KAF2165291.1 hypothetical protein M409DRAFT_24142 [Zasmidium cellare ATCC 36951]